MPTITIRRPLIALATALLLLGPATDVAAAPGFGQLLKGTNFAAFSDEDMQIFLSTAQTTVSSQPDGVDVRFNSDKSGSAGHMSVVRSYQSDGHPCRELAGETTVKKRTEPFRITYCQDPAGRWRLASTP